MKIQRFFDKDYIYFVTGKTYQNFPYFKEEIFCDLWIEELRICKDLKQFKLLAFCLNYDHFHLLLQPGEEFNISQVMQCLKCYFSQDANKIIGYNPIVAESSSSRLQVGGAIKKGREQFIKKYGTNQKQFSKFKWQPSFHDRVMRNEKDLENHFNYTAYNFQKHELPDNWKYTSLNFPELVDNIF